MLGLLSSQWQLVVPSEAGAPSKRAPRHVCFCVAAAAASVVLVAAACTRASRPAHKDILVPDWWGRPPACDFQTQGECPAKQLLESWEVCDAVAQNVVALSAVSGAPVRQQSARETTVEVFGAVAEKLHAHAPKMARKLHDVKVTHQEHQATVEMLRLMRDAEVQGVGKAVAKAIIDDVSMQRKHVTERIRRRLGPRWDSLRVLRNSAVPSSLRALWGDGNPDLVQWENRSHRLWEMTLEESNVFSMKKAEETANSEAALAQSRGQDFAVFSAALVQGRAVLDMLQMYVRAKGHSFDDELGETLGFAFGALSWPCLLDRGEADGGDAMQEVMCPLKFGAMGMDALRASFVDDASAALHARVGGGKERKEDKHKEKAAAGGGHKHDPKQKGNEEKEDHAKRKGKEKEEHSKGKEEKKEEHPKEKEKKSDEHSKGEGKEKHEHPKEKENQSDEHSKGKDKEKHEHPKEKENQSDKHSKGKGKEKNEPPKETAKTDRQSKEKAKKDQHSKEKEEHSKEKGKEEDKEHHEPHKGGHKQSENKPQARKE